MGASDTKSLCCPGEMGNRPLTLSEYRNSASRSPTRMPTPFTAVCGPVQHAILAEVVEMLTKLCPTVEKAVEYILSQPDAN